jgi:hypothetical protein
MSNDSQIQSESDEFSQESHETVNIDYLDRDISVEEVQKTISSLKRYKSCDYDNNVADFLLMQSMLYLPIYVQSLTIYIITVYILKHGLRELLLRYIKRVRYINKRAMMALRSLTCI